LTAFPLFYLLRWTYLIILIKAFIEVMVLNKYQTEKPGWETPERYQIVAVNNQLSN
jgi:hypothetical protein